MRLTALIARAVLLYEYLTVFNFHDSILCRKNYRRKLMGLRSFVNLFYPLLPSDGYRDFGIEPDSKMEKIYRAFAKSKIHEALVYLALVLTAFGLLPHTISPGEIWFLSGYTTLIVFYMWVISTRLRKGYLGTTRDEAEEIIKYILKHPPQK